MLRRAQLFLDKAQKAHWYGSQSYISVFSLSQRLMNGETVVIVRQFYIILVTTLLIEQQIEPLVASAKLLKH